MTPKFSLIVPVYNVRAYLRECIESILGQSFTDLELIAVDDCSPDGSGEILDEYAARDSRMQVLHLPHNVGLGPARDAGIDAASGEYLLFVDSDDTVTPGSLAAMAGRIDATGQPDVLIFDYARTYWTGLVARNKMAELLGASGPDVFRIDERPDLLRLLMIVWNKAYRRDFVAANGFRFPTGYYEDTPWTYPTLLAAERIAVLDEVCVHYRQRRHGNILRSRSRKHFDVFAQYERVFQFVDAHPELEQWRPFLFGRMVWHSLTILSRNDRLPASTRKEFFHKAAEQYRRFRPAGYRPPSGLAGLKVRATARDSYLAFRLTRVAARARSFAGRAARSSLRRSRRGAALARRGGLRARYRAALRRPLDDRLAVYAAYWYRGYACNPAAIYECARELVPGVHGVWVVKPEHVATMPAGVDYVLPGTPRYYDVMARAKYFVNNVNFPNDIVKRPGSVHLQTQHGTPLKKMGVELQDFPVGANEMNFEDLMERCDRWDYLISSNRFSAEIWERSYPSSYVSLETGYPRNDRLVRAGAEDVAAARAALGIAPGKRVILYAPTFRDWQRHGFEPQVDLADLLERLGPDYIVLLRAHYFYETDDRLMEQESRGALVDVSRHPVIEDLQLAADLLLTDYSSIMFDYANLDRPIVVHANDWDTYVRCRGVNFDLLACPPGVVTATQNELVDALLSGRVWGDEATRARQEFHKRFCEYDDGHAAERVVRRVFLGEPSPGPRTVRGTGIAQEAPHAASAEDDEDQEERDADGQARESRFTGERIEEEQR